jgi:hypothetical protein
MGSMLSKVQKKSLWVMFHSELLHFLNNRLHWFLWSPLNIQSMTMTF